MLDQIFHRNSFRSFLQLQTLRKRWGPFELMYFLGYGQSECTAACTLTLPGQTSVGNVGVPLPCCEIKLVDVPDMDYYAKDDKGEVCFRGSHCFKEYFKVKFTRNSLSYKATLNPLYVDALILDYVQPVDIK